MVEGLEVSDNSEFLNWIMDIKGPPKSVTDKPLDSAVMFKDGKVSEINVKSFHSGMHFKYDPDFMPPCMKFWTPEQYVGVLFQSTKTKADVTCQECLEWIHA